MTFILVAAVLVAPAIAIWPLGFFARNMGFLLSWPAAFGTYWTIGRFPALTRIAEDGQLTGWDIPIVTALAAIAAFWACAALLVNYAFLKLLPPPLGIAMPNTDA